MKPPRHLFFDFFGTLVEYRHGSRDVDPLRTFALLEPLVPKLERSELRDRIEATFARLEHDARTTLREYATLRAMHALLQSLGVAAESSVALPLADAWIEDWLTKVCPVPGLDALLCSLPAPKSIVSNTVKGSLARGCPMIEPDRRRTRQRAISPQAKRAARRSRAKSGWRRAVPAPGPARLA